MNIKKSLVAWIVGIVFVQCSYAEVAIVIHPSNPTEVMSKVELTRIYLGRSNTFPSGNTVKPLNQTGDDAVRGVLEKEYLGKSSSQIHAYWAKQMFSGQAKPPEEVSGDAAVIERVASDESAIGYVDASSVTDQVKVVNIM